MNNYDNIYTSLDLNKTFKTSDQMWILGINILTKFWGFHLTENIKLDVHIKHFSSKLDYVTQSLKDVIKGKYL